MPWAHLGSTLLASFLASLVECVEALTIVLAVGVVRGWRDALMGTAAALATLLLIVLTCRGALAALPVDLVRSVIGALLLLFGLRWLRKAILRAAGILELHDESAAYARQVRAMRAASGARGWDAVASGAAFKIVMLEGVEVIFIVTAIGANGESMQAAAAGALAALAAVILLGATLHRPLARIPENALKFAVAVLLSAFGSFWVGEGSGFTWPGGDAALGALIGAYLLIAAALVAGCRWAAGSRAARAPAADQGNAAPAAGAPAAPAGPGAALGGVLRTLLHLFVDDGALAAGVLLWIGAARYAQGHQLAPVDRPLLWAVVFTLGFAALLAYSVLRRARR
jgi:uncharacterized membrane protein